VRKTWKIKKEYKEQFPAGFVRNISLNRKRRGISPPLFRKNLDPIIHAMLNTFLCNSIL
jgi:hypothetical protein